MNTAHGVLAARPLRGQVAATMHDTPDADEPPPRKPRAPRNPGDPADADMQRRFGANLRAERERAGLLQAEVARAAGMAQQDVSDADGGAKNLTMRTMRRFALAVGCELDILLRRRRVRTR